MMTSMMSWTGRLIGRITVAALALALSVFLTMTALTSAEKSDVTPASFESECLAGGGESIDIEGPNGEILETSCKHKGKVMTCNCELLVPQSRERLRIGATDQCRSDSVNAREMDRRQPVTRPRARPHHQQRGLQRRTAATSSYLPVMPPLNAACRTELYSAPLVCRLPAARCPLTPRSRPV